MGIVVAIAQIAGSFGNQDITTPDLGGLTPKAALLFCSSATIDGSSHAHAHVSIGAVTGASNEWALTSNDEHGQVTMDSQMEVYGDRCIAQNVPGSASIDGAAHFVSWLTNGMRINWDDPMNEAYLITVVFFAGTDLTVHANRRALDTQDTVVDVTDPGFQPDLVITAMARNLALPPDTGQSKNVSLGVAHFDGVSTIVQRCWHAASQIGLGTSNVSGVYKDNRVGEVAVADGTGVDVGAEISDFDSSGFSLTARNGDGSNEAVYYLALSFGGVVNSYVETHKAATATGDDSDASIGFRPQFVMLGTTLLEVSGTYETDGLGGQVGISVFDSDTAFALSMNCEDDVGDSNTQSLNDSSAVAMPLDTGSLDIEATFVSFDDLGFTLNYSNAPTTAKFWWVLAIEGFTPTPRVFRPVQRPAFPLSAM